LHGGAQNVDLGGRHPATGRRFAKARRQASQAFAATMNFQTLLASCSSSDGKPILAMAKPLPRHRRSCIHWSNSSMAASVAAVSAHAQRHRTIGWALHHDHQPSRSAREIVSVAHQTDTPTLFRAL
jgi:hypothetical protein